MKKVSYVGAVIGSQAHEAGCLLFAKCYHDSFINGDGRNNLLRKHLGKMEGQPFFYLKQKWHLWPSH